MRLKTWAEIGGAIITFGGALLARAKWMADALGIVHLPNALRELLMKASEAPTYIVYGLFIFGLICTAFLVIDEVRAWRARRVKTCVPVAPEVVAPAPIPLYTVSTPKPIKELFETDFPLCTLMRSLTVTFEDWKLTNATMHVYQDFTSNSDFIGFYIPHCDVTFNLSVFFAHNFRKHYEELKHSIITEQGSIGVSLGKSIDLVFSGRIYVYHEDELSLRELADLTDLYKSQGLSVRSRGPKYAVDEWTQRMLASRA